MTDLVLQLVFLVPALLIGVVFHEYAHGRVAELMGDPTARRAGRLTLNPLKHLDPFGSVLLPLLLYFGSGGRFMFAAAKPVPINPMNFRHGRRDHFWVGLAGPATNFAVLVVAGSILRLTGQVLPWWIGTFLAEVVIVNLILGIFNLIPIPPLDGSRLVMAWMPARYLRGYMSVEPYGILILFGFLFFFGEYFWAVVSPLMDLVTRLFFAGAV